MEKKVYVKEFDGSYVLLWEQFIDEIEFLKQANEVIDELEDEGISQIFAELHIINNEMSLLSQLGFELKRIEGEKLIFILEL